MQIPTWFISFLGVIGTLAVPWAVWLTLQLHRLTVDTAVVRVQVDGFKEAALAFREHINDPAIHGPAIHALTTTVTALSIRVDRLESSAG